MILNTKRIHNSFGRNFPARAKQMPYLSAITSDDRGRSVIARQNCNRWQQ